MASSIRLRWLLVAILALIPSFLWPSIPFNLIQNLHQPRLPAHPPILKTIAAHLTNKARYPEEWYTPAGTPLHYDAWRLKPNEVPAEPKKRSQLLGHSARVACWPSTGGVWVKHALVSDLEFLGLPRDRDVDRQWPYHAKSEDEFCARMRRVGSQFYELPPKLDNFSCPTLEECVLPASGDMNIGFAYSYPDKTAALNLTELRAQYGLGMRGWHLATDMKERMDVAENIIFEEGLRKRNQYLRMPSNPNKWREEPAKAKIVYNGGTEEFRELWCRVYSGHCHEQEVREFPLERPKHFTEVYDYDWEAS